MESLVAPSLNLALLVAFMVFKLRGPLREFVSQRHHSISNQIESVRVQLRKAQVHYQEASEKLKSIESEIAVLREQRKQDWAASQQRILTEAREAAHAVSADAKKTAEILVLDLRGHLYSELVSQVLLKAETQLKTKLSGDDRVQIQKDFFRQMEKVE